MRDRVLSRAILLVERQVVVDRLAAGKCMIVC